MTLYTAVHKSILSLIQNGRTTNKALMDANQMTKTTLKRYVSNMLLYEWIERTRIDGTYHLSLTDLGEHMLRDRVPESSPLTRGSKPAPAADMLYLSAHDFRVARPRRDSIKDRPVYTPDTNYYGRPEGLHAFSVPSRGL